MFLNCLSVMKHTWGSYSETPKWWKHYISKHTYVYSIKFLNYRRKAEHQGNCLILTLEKEQHTQPKGKKERKQDSFHKGFLVLRGKQNGSRTTFGPGLCAAVSIYVHCLHVIIDNGPLHFQKCSGLEDKYKDKGESREGLGGCGTVGAKGSTVAFQPECVVPLEARSQNPEGGALFWQRAPSSWTTFLLHPQRAWRRWSTQQSWGC